MKTVRIKNTLMLIGVAALIMSCIDTVSVEDFDQSPAIASIKPNAASPTDSIVIFGGNFSETASENNIEFYDGVPASTVQMPELSTNAVWVVVPEGAKDGEITLTVNGLTTTSLVSFDVLDEVEISNVIPLSASVLDTIVLTGIYFDKVKKDNIVTIGGFPAEVLYSSGKVLVTVVPSEVDLGNQDVVLNAHEQTTTFTGFEVSIAPAFYFTKRLPTFTSSTLNKVSIVDKETAYVVGSNSNIYKMIDENRNWESWINLKSTLPPSILNVTLRDVHAIDANNVLVCGSDGTFIKSTDGGATWTIVDVETTQRLRRMYFINNTHGWMVGSGGLIYKTTDGGDSWTKQLSGTSVSLYGVFFHDENNGYVVGNDSILLRTTDGGDTWNSTFISAAAEVTGESEDLLSIVFQDAQNGWITGDDNVLLATTDGGVTWTNQRIVLSDRGHDINDITVLGNGHIIAVADLSQTIRSEDSGASWTVSDRTTDLFYIGGNIEGIDSYTDVDTSTDFAVAVAVNGGILH